MTIKEKQKRFEELLLEAWVDEGGLEEPCDGTSLYELDLNGRRVQLFPTRVLVTPTGWPEISEETKQAMLEHAYPKIEEAERRRKSGGYKLDRAISLLEDKLNDW